MQIRIIANGETNIIFELEFNKTANIEKHWKKLKECYFQEIISYYNFNEQELRQNYRNFTINFTGDS